MANRIRNEQLKMKLTEEEKALFEEKRTAETEGEFKEEYSKKIQSVFYQFDRD